MGKVLLPGTVFTLDMGFPPDVNAAKAFAGLESGVNSGLPFLLLVQLLLKFLPLWLLQKVALFFIFFLAGVGAHRLSPARSDAGKYFTGLLYTLNPFTFVRFETGQWLILLGYALTPFLIRRFLVFLKAQHRFLEGVKVALWFTAVGAVSAHIFMMDFIPVLILFAVYTSNEGRKASWKATLLRNGGALALLLGVVLLTNLYWMALFTSGSLLERFGDADLAVFRSDPHGVGTGLAYALASLHGFWRLPEGYEYIVSIIPFWAVFFFITLFLFVYGFVLYWNHRKLGTAAITVFLTAGLGLLLAFGTDAPWFLGRFFRALYDDLYVVRAFREPQKFVAFAALGYAFLGGLAVSHLTRYFVIFKQKPLYFLALIVAIITPLLFSANMLFGIGGSPVVRDYPAGWKEAKTFLQPDGGDGRVLVLPWHAYINFSWVGRTIDNPAALFFPGDIIFGKNIETGGIYSESSDPDQLYIQALLENRPNLDDFGHLVAPLNVAYIILLKEVDHQEYAFLYRQTDLEIALDNTELVIFRNLRESAAVERVGEKADPDKVAAAFYLPNRFLERLPLYLVSAVWLVFLLVMRIRGCQT
jgi:hypothetical protein